MGSADLSCTSLVALITSPAFQVVLAVTQPDRPRGRNLQLQASPVKVLAQSRGLPVAQPERARDPRFVQELSDYHADLIVVVAYGQILPPAILELPRLGCVNVHTSLLPKYRGASPIQSAILDDQPETGVTLMKMDAGLDTGPILSMAKTGIAPEDDAGTLHDRLAQLGAELLLSTLPEYAAGKITPLPQPSDGVSHTKKITKEDGRIDWSKPARAIWNRVRGLTPWPGAFTSQFGAPQPRMIKIWRALPEEAMTGIPGTILGADPTGLVVACGQGALRILELQREGGRRMSAADFLLGQRLAVGDRLPQ